MVQQKKDYVTFAIIPINGEPLKVGQGKYYSKKKPRDPLHPLVEFYRDPQCRLENLSAGEQ